MKVITEKGGVKARSVNDRAIEHSISQKTELSKKNEKELTSKTERTVHQADRNVPKSETSQNAVPNRPIPAQQKKKEVAFEQPQFRETTSTAQSKSVMEQRHIGSHSEKSQPQEIGNKTAFTASGKKPHPKFPNADVGKKVQSRPQAGIKTTETTAKKTAPTPFRPPKQYKLSPYQPKNRKYKVLKNGTVNNGTLTKRKERVIYSQQQNKKLRKIKRKKIDKSRLKLLKSFNKQQKRIFRKKSELISIAMGGVVPAKVDIKKYRKLSSAAQTAAKVASKPTELLKKGFVAQAEKSDDNGVKVAKLGVQIYDYGTSGVKTAVNTGVRTAQKGAKLTKRVYRKLHKPTSAEIRRKLRKRVNHNLTAEAKFLAKRAMKKGAAKAGKATAQAAKTAAKAAQKAVQAAAKAVVNVVGKIASFITSTMPYSLIIIGAILLILILCLCMTEVIGGAGGSVAGGGAWLVDDNSSQTPEEIYEGYKKFIEQAKEVMETQAKDALKNTVTSFCESDTTEPRKIIQYIDKNNDRTFYPAAGADRTINALIDGFGTDDYADYMSLLFVLMTREKQQADGVSDGEIYDFDFKKEDFEEFMKTVNENSCRWGDTFVIKTAVETSPVACPSQNCKTKYKSDRCASYTDEEGHKHYYCKGHPYCPINHTKLTVQLYTVKDYYGKEYSEIYNFTDNEKARYEASKALIQGMIDYWEGGGSN